MISDNAIKVCSSLVRNVPLWMGISLVWEAVHTWGQGLCGNSLHSMSHFAVNLELLQRNKAYSKRKLDIQAANEETCAGKQKH